MGEIIFHIGILGALGLLFSETQKISVARVADAVGPAGFPRGIILLAAVLTAFSLYRVFRAYLVNRNNGEASPGIEEMNIKFLGVLGSIIFFIFLNSIIGFFLSSLMLVASIMFLLGNRERLKILICYSVRCSLVHCLIRSSSQCPSSQGNGHYQRYQLFSLLRRMNNGFFFICRSIATCFYTN